MHNTLRHLKQHPHPRSLAAFVIAVAGLCIFMAYYAMDFYQSGGMVKGHIRYARNIENGTDLIPHPGIFWLNSYVRSLFSLSVKESLFILGSLHFPLTLIAILWALAKLSTERLSYTVLLLCGIAVLYASPIGLPWLDPHVYNYAFRNRATVLIRSVTHVTVLPYAITAFALLIMILHRQIKHQTIPITTLLIASILLLASTIIKPSVSISLIPAIALYLMLSRYMNIRGLMTLALVVLPSVLVLVWQIYIGTMDNPHRALIKLGFDPFFTLTGNNHIPSLALLLGLVFPLYMLCIQRTQLSLATKIAWLNLVIAAIPFCLLTMGDGIARENRDLEWSYLHGKQLLFLCVTIDWLRYCKEKTLGSNRFFPNNIDARHIGAVLLMAHAFFGYSRFILVDIK